ncbi:2031_t:CDS:10 [Ambispora gerdemannii]|uniref:2031_t:CDS:1 n=1 Tax=Ambispora gerdemannii TaxID=144530 RepID=A0A9N8V4S0_9GLOM|nr:2031_t:CDS:10 [Ambispora gerdemannii]
MESQKNKFGNTSSSTSKKTKRRIKRRASFEDQEWRKISSVTLPLANSKPEKPIKNAATLVLKNDKKRKRTEVETEIVKNVSHVKKKKRKQTSQESKKGKNAVLMKDNDVEIDEVNVDNDPGDMNKWNWKEAKYPDEIVLGDEDLEGILCLEECDDVDVVYEGNKKSGRVVKFKKIKKETATNKNESKSRAANPEEPLSIDETRNYYDLDTFDEGSISFFNNEEDDDTSNNNEKSDDEIMGIDDSHENSDSQNSVGHVEENKNKSKEKKKASKSFIINDDNDEVDNLTKNNVLPVVSQNRKDALIKDVNLDFNASAWIAFGLCSNIILALKSLQFSEPTPIQKKTLPHGLSGRDIIGAAETGSGKTLAFGLPILQYLMNEGNKPIGEKLRDVNDPRTNELVALIVTPTRELAIQVKDHILSIGKFGDVKVITLVGGMAVQKQRRLMDKHPNIIVATPGRLWEVVSENVEYLEKIRRIKFFVLDEADRMLESGHFQELNQIVNCLSKSQQKTNDWSDNESKEPTGINKKTNKKEKNPSKRQTFIFSATLDKNLKENLKKKKKHFKNTLKKFEVNKTRATMKELMERLEFTDPDPIFIDITPEHVVSSTLQESKIDCLTTEKDVYIYYFITRYPGRTLIFVNSINTIRGLIPIMRLLGIEVLGLHAQMQQRQRLKNLDRFKQNPKAVMIASDVAARGLDIPLVDHVVHYQLPRSGDIYVHRSGRTARVRREGISLMLCSPEEIVLYRKICQKLKKDEGLSNFPVDQSIVKAIKQRITLARKIDQDEHKLQKNNYDDDWLKKVAQDLDVDVDEDL